VNGDLTLSGGVEFYGPVVARGTVKSTGNFHFHGGMISGAADLANQSLLSGMTKIEYSSCVVRRAIANSAASRPAVLTEHAWFSGR
jgi:hypothetical protein